MAVDQRFVELLALLVGSQVEFVVVGGVAAVLSGAPIATFDLDVVAEPSAENLARLSSALATVDARYVDFAGRTIQPTTERLMQNRMNLLETHLGRLDVAREIGHGWGWAESRQHSREVTLGALACRVLDLEAVIETKRQAGREKDLAVIPVLEETLRLSRLGQGEGAE